MEIRVFKFTGLTPLLMSNIASAGNPDMPTLTVGKKPNKGDFEKIADALAYKNKDGTLFLKSEAFRSSLIKGATGKKFGKQAAPAVLKGFIFTSAEEQVSLIDLKGRPIKKYEIQIDSGVAKKINRIIVVRPRIDEWSATVPFDCESDPKFRPSNYEEFLDQIEKLWNYAGRTVGVGAWRPEKSGKYGRYSVEMQK